MLHTNVRNAYKKDLPRFPNKRCYGNTDPRFIEYRKKALENYLNTILINISVDQIAPLQDFLILTKNGKYNALESVFPSKMNKFEISSDFNPSFEETFPKEKNEKNLILEKSVKNNKLSQNVNEVKNFFIDINFDDYDLPDEETVAKKQVKLNFSFKEKYLKISNANLEKLKKNNKIAFPVPAEKGINSENLFRKSLSKENNEIIENFDKIFNNLEGKFESLIKSNESFVFQIKI